MFNVGILATGPTVPPEAIRDEGYLITRGLPYGGTITFNTDGTLVGSNLNTFWLFNAKPDAGSRYTVRFTFPAGGGKPPTSPSLNTDHSLSSSVHVRWGAPGQFNSVLTAVITEVATGKTGSFGLGIGT